MAHRFPPDFTPTPKVEALSKQLEQFMEHFVYPNERRYYEQIEAAGDRHHRPAILEDLKAREDER